MTVPEWADLYRHLSTSSGAVGGPWSTDRVEVARGPMMAVTEPGVRVITAMTCTQLLKTSLLENIIGYFAHLDPCPMLLTQPKDEAVDAFSKERLVPMVKASPELRKIFAERRTRVSDDTLKFKTFPGGFLAMGSAGSPTNLAMRAIRVTLADEIDKYEATKEGDPLILLEERTATFATAALSIRTCSPTWEETSRIYRSYLDGDMRVPVVRCPHCGEYVHLGFFDNVEWEKTEDGEHLPDTAAILCRSCGAFWSEADRIRAITTKHNIRWRQTKPFVCCGERQAPGAWEWDEINQVEYAICGICGKRAVSNYHASFTASKLYSPFTSTVELAKKWLSSKEDAESKQTFYNTQLGQPFKAQVSRDINQNSLMARREVYAAPVPDGVVVLTAGVDVQSGGSANEGRLEIEVVGWGLGEESWSIETKIINGDPARPEIWKALDEFLLKPFKHVRGFDLHLSAACVDSGGHSTQEVYNFTRARTGRNIWSTKGASDRAGQWSPVWPPSPKHEKFRTGHRPVIIGVNSAKEAVRQRLLIETAGPGYCHFPADRPQSWFDQLTSEKLIIEKVNGVNTRRWLMQRGRANEALDCRVYAYAALCGLYITRRLKLEYQSELLAGYAAQKPAARQAAPPRRKSRRSRFME